MSARLNVDYMDLEPLITKLQETLPNDEKLTRNDAKRFEAIFCLLAEINNGGWISVKDRLPNVSGYVLTCARISRRIDTLFYSTDYKAFNAKYTAETAVPVTHWMPLPEPPEVKR